MPLIPFVLHIILSNGEFQSLVLNFPQELTHHAIDPSYHRNTRISRGTHLVIYWIADFATGSNPFLTSKNTMDTPPKAFSSTRPTLLLVYPPPIRLWSTISHQLKYLLSQYTCKYKQTINDIFIKIKIKNIKN